MLQDGGEHTGTARSPAGPEGLKERSEHWRDYNSRRASRRAAYGSRRAPRAGVPWPRPPPGRDARGLYGDAVTSRAG